MPTQMIRLFYEGKGGPVHARYIAAHLVDEAEVYFDRAGSQDPTNDYRETPWWVTVRAPRARPQVRCTSNHILSMHATREEALDALAEVVRKIESSEVQR